MKLFLPALLTTYLFISGASARELSDTVASKNREPIQKFYVGGGLDGALFSSATIEKLAFPAGGSPVTVNSTARLRFSYIINTGVSFNFNFGRHIGAFTGIDIKNIGFIENMNSLITKRRTYNVGVPLGIKIGNMRKKGTYLFLGGGADVPINYREKTYVIRDQKTKFNEWFSERTPHIMPYVFVGMKLHKGFTVKAQYYPNNYLNPDFQTVLSSIPYKPYWGYNVHLMQLSFGYSMHYSKRHDAVKKQVSGLNTM